MNIGLDVLPNPVNIFLTVTVKHIFLVINKSATAPATHCVIKLIKYGRDERKAF
jgi:hypothetical protein